MPYAPKWSHNGLVEFTFRLGRERLYPHPAVVTTDPASANADCDNGAGLHGAPRLRGRDEGTAHRVVREAREEAEVTQIRFPITSLKRFERASRNVAKSSASKASTASGGIRLLTITSSNCSLPKADL